MHLLKQQLCQRSTELFAGEPQQFNACNRMEGLPLSNWDKLLILEANTTKRLQKLVQKHMVIGGSNSAVRLAMCLDTLKGGFGSNFQIATALTQQHKNVVPLKSANQTERLKVLLELCEYIEINMILSDELHIFNTAQRARKIWLKYRILYTIHGNLFATTSV